MNYSLTSPKWEGEIKLEYHDNGQLKQAQLPEAFDAVSLMWLSEHFPVHINFLKFLKENSKVKITEIELPIMFEDFWNKYAHKVGSKDVANEYWDGSKRTCNKRPITETDRKDIMSILPRFLSRYKGEKKEWQPLATTFLNKRLWVAELESSPKINEAVSEFAKNIANKWAERLKKE